MPKVICRLENAAEVINGVKFTALEDGGRISEEISADEAELFASINGYELVSDKPKKAAAAKKEPAKEEAAPVVPDADETVF